MMPDKPDFFYQLADALEGKSKKGVKVGITIVGSEHPPEILAQAAKNARDSFEGIDVIAIGPEKTLKDAEIQGIAVDCLADAHKIMEKLLANHELDAAVTMHYNFPLGVSSVGKVLTPGRGRPMFIATATGSAAAGRVEAMVRNAIYGIIAAKASGIEKPSLGILNLDGSRQAERILRTLAERGYEINFAESLRADGGCIMRGNDLLAGSCDVMVTDTLTGNILMKVFSAYTTGGDYEALGWGYGPGVGENMDKIILILSRTSGAPVVEGAIRYAVEMVRGNLIEKCREEFQKLKMFGFNNILNDLTKSGILNKNLAGADNAKDAASVLSPPKKVVTEEIGGIDVLQMEDAVKILWKNGIYAESGMGCTGPVIMIAEDDLQNAVNILKVERYI